MNNIKTINTLLFILVIPIIFYISFPVFGELMVFVVNFIQMLGSFISVGALSLFSLIEIDSTGTLLLFILILSLIQLIFDGFAEPMLMGKSFSINVISILVILMFWGFLRGIPGLIMSVPLTVFIKIILEQFKSTQVVAKLLSGNNIGLQIPFKQKKMKL